MNILLAFSLGLGLGAFVMRLVDRPLHTTIRLLSHSLRVEQQRCANLTATLAAVDAQLRMGTVERWIQDLEHDLGVA